MAADFSKLLDKIAEDNHALRSAHAALGKAFEKLDQRLNQLKAGMRIEPYPVGKGEDSPVLGFKRYHDGWHITTLIKGLGDTQSEAPAAEAPPELQVLLVGHLAGLLGKISDALAANLKAASAASKEADKVVDAIQANG